MFWTQIRMKGDRGFRLARAAALAALAALIVGLLAVGSGLKGAAVIPRGLAGRPGGEETRAVAQRLAVLERGWVPNAGQWDERAAFAAPGFFGITWVTKDGELWHVASKEDCEKRTPEAGEPEVPFKRFRKPCPVQSWVLAERWVGGKVKGIRGEEELETRVSYFIGNDPAKHRSALPSYRYLSLGEVWPGVEVKLKASQKTVEKLFYVRPGADLGKVRVEFRGANRLRLSQEGELVIETGLGELVLSKPVAWQEKDGQKLPVQASYRLFGKSRYGFAVQGADPSLPLVIDPILQATYLGGSDDDGAFALAIHPSTGEVYVAGSTDSVDFPHTDSGAQASKGDFSDAFVARLNATLTSNLQSTYLGGGGAIVPSRWPSPAAVMCTWRGRPIPPTSPTPAAARRKPKAAVLTPSWRGLTPASPPTYSPPTWGEAMWMGPTRWPLPAAARCTWRGAPLPPTSPTPTTARRQVTAAVATTLSWRGSIHCSRKTPSPPTWGEARPMRPSRWPSVRHQTTTFTWRGAPIPPTSPTPAAARRQATAAASVTLSWRGLTPASPPTFSLPTWGEAGTMTPTRWPSVRHQTTTFTWRGAPLPPTSPTPTTARRQATAAAAATPSWRG